MNEYELEEEIKQRDSTIKTILIKFQHADEERLKFKRMNVELEIKVEELKKEIDSLKNSAALEKIFSDHEFRKVCDEIIKVKNEIKGKVVEQNKLIKILAEKIKNPTTVNLSVESVNNENNNHKNLAQTLINNLDDEDLMEYRTVQEIPFDDANTMIQVNNLDFYECPKCKLAINNNFTLFQIHVNNCSNDKISCPICFKLFNNQDNKQFVEHVHQHN
jgi:hypothetical protein